MIQDRKVIHLTAPAGHRVLVKTLGGLIVACVDMPDLAEAPDAPQPAAEPATAERVKVAAFSYASFTCRTHGHGKHRRARPDDEWQCCACAYGSNGHKEASDAAK